MSDDGRSAIVIIALLGNPFSPAYARARDAGPASALRYCSINVALYAGLNRAWALHERPLSAGARDATGLRVGGSSMRWEGDRLVVSVNERTTPFHRPLRGTIVLHPETHSGLELPIDDHGQHRWWPIAPLARIEVDLPLPGVKFTGHGYHDANAGDVPLDASFDSWSWSRARTQDGALLTYDVACSSGASRSHTFNVSPRGDIEQLALPWKAPLRRTVWGLPRHARGDKDQRARIVRTLEDGPFYARALVETRHAGRPVLAMHEVLAAQRLRRPWVRAVTNLRMRTT